MGQLVIGADGTQHIFPDNATPDQMQAALAGSGAAPTVQASRVAQRGPLAISGGNTPPDPAAAFLNTYVSTPARRAASDMLGIAGSASEGLANGGAGPINQAFQAITLGPGAALGTGPTAQGQNLRLPTIGGVRDIIGAGQDAPTSGGRIAQTAMEGGIAGLPFAGAGILPAAMGAVSGGAQQGTKEAGGSPLMQEVAGMLPLVLGAGAGALKLGAKSLGLVNPASVMREKIVTALTNDGISPQQAATTYANWQLQGAKPEALMDLGGDSMRRLARSIYTTQGGSGGPAGGPASLVESNLGNRSDLRPDRILGDFNDTARNGAPMTNLYEATDAVRAARARAADPNWKAAYSAPQLTPEQMGPINDLMNRGSMTNAVKNAVKIANEEGIPESELGIAFDKNGKPTFTTTPSWQTLDYIKRGLSDVVEGYRDPVTGKLNLNTLGRAQNNTLHDYLGILKDENPAYAKALSDFSDRSATLNAMTQGRDFLTQDPEITKAQLGKLGPADQDAYRLAAARALQDKMGGAGGANQIMSPYSDTPRNSNIRDRLNAVFGDEATYQQFAARVAREANMAKGERQVLGGSQTANKLEDVKSGGQQAFEGGKAALGSMITGRPDLFLKWLIDTGGQAMGRAKGITPEVAKLLAPALTDPTTDIVGLLGELAKRGQNPKPGFLTNYAIPSGLLGPRLGAPSQGQ